MPRRTRPRTVEAAEPLLPLFAAPPLPQPVLEPDDVAAAPVEPPESEREAMVDAYLVEHAADNARGEAAFDAAMNRGEDVRDAAGAYLAAAYPATKATPVPSPLVVRIFNVGSYIDVSADTPDGPITSPRPLTADETDVARETFRSILRDAARGITCTDP